jgi:hypothetical protein
MFTRRLVSSMRLMSIATFVPRIWRAAASPASEFTTASVFDGMKDRAQWMT